MLSENENEYIKKSLINKLKFWRYMAYIMISISLFWLGFPASFYELKKGNIVNAIISILVSILYPAVFFFGICVLFEFITGNQLFRFIRGKYVVARETLYGKYSESISSNPRISI